MTLTPADIARLHAIKPSPRQVAPQPEGDAVQPVARWLMHDRLMEALSERERFLAAGLPYDEVPQ